EADVVDVAPAPLLARLERADDRMRRRLTMRGRVAAGRAVAATNVPARETDPQVQPLPAVAQAVLAAVDRRRELVERDLIEMGADVTHATATGIEVARCPWTNWTAIEPSPTAAAQRFVEPE